MNSFWADRATDEPAIWVAFLRAIVGAGSDFVIFHYGSYESLFLRLMAKLHGGNPALIERIESRSVNVLSLIYSRVFFPTYANDLKSIAGFLGFKWSSPNAFGLQSMVWAGLCASSMLGFSAFWRRCVPAHSFQICSDLSAASENPRRCQAEQPNGCGLRHVSHQAVGLSECINRRVIGGR
jgi:RNase_H superfamily